MGATSRYWTIWRISPSSKGVGYESYLVSTAQNLGGVAKNGTADDKVGNCVSLLSSPCPSPTFLSCAEQGKLRLRSLPTRNHLAMCPLVFDLPVVIPASSRDGWAFEAGRFITQRFIALVQQYGPELEKRCPSGTRRRLRRETRLQHWLTASD